jgi:hypothetical protein
LRQIFEGLSEPAWKPIFLMVTNIVMYLTLFVVNLIVFLDNEKFAGNESTLLQQIVVPLWLIAGTLYRAFASFGQYLFPTGAIGKAGKITALCIGGIPAISGFVVVTQMLVRYGNCIKYT